MDEEKKYNADELAEIFDVSVSGIRSRVSHVKDKSAFTKEVVFDARNAPHPQYVFTLKEAKLYDIIPKKKERKPIKPKVPENIEEMRAAHPLVKDDRFFKLSYFPEVVPDYFKESDDKKKGVV